jgi:DNA-binding response OmpR family regulator
LRDAGLNVLEVGDYSEGTSFLTHCLPPVVIISEDVPELSHPATLATLKGSFELPVMVLGSGEETSVVAAIQRGADGYLDRRASSREQLARTRAVLRRVGVTKR